MFRYRLESMLAVLLVALTVVFVAANLPVNPQLIDWILPVLGAVIGVFWMLTHDAGQHQR